MATSEQNLQRWLFLIRLCGNYFENVVWQMLRILLMHQTCGFTIPTHRRKYAPAPARYLLPVLQIMPGNPKYDQFH